MADLYKELGNLIVETIDDEWNKVIIKITSSMNKMCIFDCSYSDNSENIRKFSFDKMKGFLMGKNGRVRQLQFSEHEPLKTQLRLGAVVGPVRKLTEFPHRSNVFKLQESMSPKHKWNSAVYTLEKSGHFSMDFKWNQELQDEWDGKK